jgi:hypothetical protein
LADPLEEVEIATITSNREHFENIPCWSILQWSEKVRIHSVMDYMDATSWHTMRFKKTPLGFAHDDDGIKSAQSGWKVNTLTKRI